jgi:hypothetical protein
MAMKKSVCLALILIALVSLAATACTDSEAAGDYYDNDTHGGYPGPGTRTLGRDG